MIRLLSPLSLKTNEAFSQPVKCDDVVLPEKTYFVYLLLCDDGSYYTGYTDNVTSRLAKHRAGRGARYTRMHKPKEVVYVEEFKTRRAATRREQQIKDLSHREEHELASKSPSNMTQS